MKYDGWQHYPTKYTAIKEVKIGIENREIVSKMTINYDLEIRTSIIALFFSFPGRIMLSSPLMILRYLRIQKTI